MDGSCDLTGCTDRTLLGWRPLTERLGRKICEDHWRRHEDQQDSFDLFEAFGFKRPAGIPTQVTKKGIARCACGREREPSRRFCAVCAAGRERQRKRQAYHDRKKRQTEPVVEENSLRCRQCGQARSLGHTYCPKCSERRKTTSHRRRQSRYWRKLHICQGSD